MPPKRGIVKSGNAGNSNKPAKSAPPAEPTLAGRQENQLFPPGSKTPLSLLNERCQKNGWERATVETFTDNNKGWRFRVKISRKNKNELETVIMEPHPAYHCPTALEARHWGATYALHRFCSSLQLNRVLPPGPREYWQTLSNEQKQAPEHLNWQYNPDPFLAQKEVKQRQAAAESRKQAASTSDVSDAPQQSRKPVPSAFLQPLEARMSTSLRELVESAIKQGMEMYPEVSDRTLPHSDLGDLVKQLTTVGFTNSQARDATTFLSRESPLAAHLLHAAPPLEACIEYLVLQVPECDLPSRFLPDKNSSDPFIKGVQSANRDIKSVWLESMAIKQGGWPADAVKEVLLDSSITDWDSLLVRLGDKLIGLDTDAAHSSGDPYIVEADEAEALGAHFENSELCMPLFSAEIVMHVPVDAGRRCPRPGFLPVYLSSPSVPAYVRLHLLSCLLQAANRQALLEPEEGFCMACMRILENEWSNIEANGKPDINEVLKHLMPKNRTHVQPIVPEEFASPELPSSRKPRRPSYHKPSSHPKVKDTMADPERLKIQDLRQKLPAFQAKTHFMSLLAAHQVVVVVGETVPQYILESMAEGESAMILITQPRRLSAVSVAKRVAQERMEDGSVGYSIRGETRMTSATRLLFCTTGVVLRRLSLGSGLKDVTHVIVDEAHERSLDGDILMLELRELLPKMPHLKIILMSATMNHQVLADYFDGAPILTIPGLTHPVTDIYLEDIVSRTRYRPSRAHNRWNKQSKTRHSEVQAQLKSKGLGDDDANAIATLEAEDNVDYGLIAATVGHILSTSNDKGGILIFLPGVQEIRQCIESLRRILGSARADILPLHANLTIEEQRKVFSPTAGWKIIASTNVAETSVTIDDVLFVIDTGRVKDTQPDPETGLISLKEGWVSQASARQRRGRAGRTRPGTAFKLYTRKRESEMSKFPVPEILRVPLESVSLMIKANREQEDVKLFLSRAIDAPSVIAMEKAWEVLLDLGAVDESGLITPLGRHMSLLPLDLRLAKMLVLGTIFRCLDPVLTIAAIMSSKPLFLSPLEKREEAQKAKNNLSTDLSDALTEYQAYNACVQLGPRELAEYCDVHFISSSTVREVKMLRMDYLSRLADLGFVPLETVPDDPTLNVYSGKPEILKGILLGGMYPQVARVSLPSRAIKYDQLQAGTVQRANTAKEYQFHDMFSKDVQGRLFLHPSSVLFEETRWQSKVVVYFQKVSTSKIFIRGVTEIPLFALLLFGGPVSVKHITGSLRVGSEDKNFMIKAVPRIGILVNQLRRLLDAQLLRCITDGSMLVSGPSANAVLHAMTALLARDGLSE